MDYGGKLADVYKRQVYDTETHKWNVKFNNGKSYSYAYMNVEKLTKPDVLNPKSYRISREGQMCIRDRTNSQNSAWTKNCWRKSNKRNN